jgi:NitT/TauT family transport system ATP-binding protein
VRWLGQRVLVLSTSPTVVLEDVVIDLPAERDQLTIRSLPRFAELRGHVYRLVQQAKRGGAAVGEPPGRATEAM